MINVNTITEYPMWTSVSILKGPFPSQNTTTVRGVTAYLTHLDMKWPQEDDVNVVLDKLYPGSWAVIHDSNFNQVARVVYHDGDGNTIDVSDMDFLDTWAMSPSDFMIAMSRIEPA